jgi:5-methyltetrahydrofolate--homocysteine methyltransferase
VTITDNALIPGLNRAGDLFEQGEFFVPEMLIAAQAMEAGMNLLRPLLAAGDYEPLGKVVMGTVEGDLHDIGKKLVSMMLEGRGFEVIDLGVDVPAQRFVDAVEETGAKLVGLSTLLTTTMPSMEATVRLLRENDPSRQIRVMIGGAPVTPAYAEEIGADGSAPNATRAAKLACEMIEQI